MAGQTKAILKAYFEAGKAPTQDEFANLIDSIFEKKEHLIPFEASGFVSDLDLGSTDKRFKETHFKTTTLWPFGRLNGTMYNKEIVTLASGNTNLRFSQGNTFYIRLTEDTVVSLPDSSVGVYTLIAEQDSEGDNNIVFIDVFQTGSFDTAPNAINFITIICDHTNKYVIINK